ncbi:MAG: hypothetical protein RLY24_1214 [Actinomycetota bacterium]|jgi:predicted ferric reductase
MLSSVWWDLTRASANVAWALCLFTILWGVLLTTRILRDMDRPAWLRDLHSWLGGLTVAFTVVHMLTLVQDNYINFEIVDTLVPFSSSYRPLPVAFGVVGFWLLVVIQGTSLMMKKMSRTMWRRIHMMSYPLYAIIIVHALSAGSDVGTPLYTGVSMALAMTGTAVGGIRWVAGRSVDRKKRAKASS